MGNMMMLDDDDQDDDSRTTIRMMMKPTHTEITIQHAHTTPQRKILWELGEDGGGGTF